MSQEGHLIDKKSLRTVLGRKADWDGLVKDCVVFAKNVSADHLKVIGQNGANPRRLGDNFSTVNEHVQ